MDNSLKTKEKPPEAEGLTPPAKGKTKTFLIGKELKTNALHHTAAEWASGPTTKPNPKPESKPRIASAKGRVKPLARLLRCATALRVTAPLGCGSRRPVWPKGSLPARHTRPETPQAPLFPRKQRFPFGWARSGPGREAAKRTLDGEDRSGILRGEGKGNRCRRLAQRNGFATIRPRTCFQGA